MGIEKFLLNRRVFSLGFAAAFLAPFAKAAAAEGAGNGSGFKGTLYPIGGASFTTLRRFAELAGGSSGKILILPHASSAPGESADELANAFLGFGVKDTEVLMPNEKKSLPHCSAIFMSGGDQSRLVRLLDKAFVQQMRDFLRDGNLIGGTSAGAAAVPSRMIADGMSDGLPHSGSLVITDGLGLLPGYMVDTHVGARARQDRLMVGLSLESGLRGIGLDEDTAVEIKDGKATVHGHGLAHVYRRSSEFKSKYADAPEGTMASVQNMIYSIYPAGETFLL